MPANLALITSVANQLLEANASTATQASEQVLAQLVEHFDLHYAFLRYSDHNIRASVLAAEWPRRSDVANPDPFAFVSFTNDRPCLRAMRKRQGSGGCPPPPPKRGFRCPITRAVAAADRWWSPPRWPPAR